MRCETGTPDIAEDYNGEIDDPGRWGFCEGRPISTHGSPRADEEYFSGKKNRGSKAEDAKVRSRAIGNGPCGPIRGEKPRRRRLRARLQNQP
jgi:hypothetical protein